MKFIKVFEKGKRVWTCESVRELKHLYV